MIAVMPLRRGVAIALLTLTIAEPAALAARIVAARVSGRNSQGDADVRDTFGAGMRVVRQGRGQYLVLFDPDFDCRPVVTVTAQGSDGGKPIVGTITDLEDDRVKVRFRNPATGDGADPREFHMIAIGCD